MLRVDISSVTAGDLVQGNEMGTGRCYAGRVLVVWPDGVKIRIGFKDNDPIGVTTWLEPSPLYHWNPQETEIPVTTNNADFPHVCTRCGQRAYLGAIRAVKHANRGDCPDV